MQKRYAVSPMGMDCNMGAIRAVYPIKNALCYVHGSVGCSFLARWLFSWHDNYQIRVLSSLIDSRDVIFGGEELLQEGLMKAVDAIRPELIVIQNTCIPALIGDDSERVARSVSERAKVKIISTTNPNYKGNQLTGYKNVVNAYINSLMEKPTKIKKKNVNILGIMPGEFNWTNDQRELVRILDSIGLSVNCILVGDGTKIDEIIHAPEAEANVLVYPEVGIEAAQLMKEKFGTPYIETNLPPIGIESTKEWILKIGEFFGLEKQAKGFIEDELMAMGQCLNRLDEGQYFNLAFLFGKTYAIESASFLIPPMVKLLYEDLSMIPTTIAFQEYDPLSFAKLEKIMKDYNIKVEIQTSGDHKEFQESIKQNHRYPYGDPWIVIGSTMDALDLAFCGERLPVVRFSYPVFDESIITRDRPFVGFKGVVTLTERIHNTFLQKIGYTSYAIGNIPDPYAIVEDMIKSLQ